MIGEELEIGALIAFVMYIQRFFDPIRHLTMTYTQLQRAMASGIRIFDLLDAKPDLADVKDASELSNIKGDIEFQKVSFFYKPGDDVLKNISIHIKAGETVAIVGPTGAGKTTLIKLLFRFLSISLTVKSNLFLSRLPASFPPTLPKPIKPIFIFNSLF